MSSGKGTATAEINTWEPTPEQVIVEKDGKLFLCHFEKLFGYADKLSPYKIFVIGKESYTNQLDIICKYVNYFINRYDYEEYEVPSAYLKIKYALDKKKAYTAENMNAYIDYLYEILFTPTVIEHIEKMVEDNYLDDIETSDDDEPILRRKKYVKNEKKHLESLEFNNQHIKVLLQISFAMKLMSPVLFHYIQSNTIKIEKDSDIIFNFYSRLFEIFSHGTVYNLYDNDSNIVESDLTKEDIDELVDKGEIKNIIHNDYDILYMRTDGTGYYMRNKINMYNKLYVYVKSKVMESNASNSPIFAQREVFGVDMFSVIKSFTRKVLISENIVKYKFNEHWDSKLKKYKENVIGFNKTILKFQLNYFLREQYGKNLTEITNTKSSDGLSGLDKLLMNSNKLDEGSIVLTDLNIKLTTDRLSKMIDIPITEDEIKFYMVNHKPSKEQQQMVHAYYAKYFGSYKDLNLLNRHDYMKLLLLLKNKLLIDLGYDEDEKGNIYSAVLPYILTGNVKDKVSNRLIRNNKLITKIEESYLYQDLIHNKYKMLESISPDYILTLISSIMNSKFTYVTYENQSLCGTEIVYNEDKIADELLFFLNNI